MPEYVPYKVPCAMMNGYFQSRLEAIEDAAAYHDPTESTLKLVPLGCDFQQNCSKKMMVDIMFREEEIELEVSDMGTCPLNEAGEN